MQSITDYIKSLSKETHLNQARIILTGAPGAGKTTLINQLAKLGKTTISEAAHDVIAREQAAGCSKPWDKPGFRDHIVLLQRQRQQTASALKASQVFFDRSPIDTISFCLRHGATPEKELLIEVKHIVESQYYHRTVFLIEMLDFVEKTAVRTEDYEESALMQRLLEENYTKLGFKVIKIPPASVETRIQHLLKALRETTFHFTAARIEENAIQFAKETSELPHLQFRKTNFGNFFGLKKELQLSLDFEKARPLILQNMGLPPDAKFLQVVGDSAKFSAAGTEAGRRFLEKHLADDSKAILWGFTGQGLSGDAALDVNQLVNDWVDADKARSSRTLANVVDFHTVKAIRDWKCSISTSNYNFFVVYGDAKFGDDVISSDSLTDVAVCLEGGVQSFCQIVNFLDRKRKVVGIYNLRGSTNPAYFDPETKQYMVYFSAGEFLSLLKSEVDRKKEITSADIEKFKDAYLKTHQLINLRRPDAETKQALFDAAWTLFQEKRLWQRLEICEFEMFKE